MQRRASSDRTLLPYVLFFGSGLSGLVYQVLWVRQFGNVFGNTVHSAALVTAVFMCGLGVGSYLAGAWADRRFAEDRGGSASRAALLAYGGSEILIGAIGAGLGLVLPRLTALSPRLSSYTPGAHGFLETSAGTQALRYGAAALMLAPITMLMGGTLTLLIRHVVARRLDEAGVRIGLLYGLNTAGAALGCYLTDATLVPSFGVLRTQLAAAALNVVVGGLALAAARRHSAGGPEARASEGPRADAGADPGSSRVVVLTAVAIALTGLAGMGMEIVWFRFLVSALGAYRSTFSLLLTVILVGVWLGSSLGGWLQRRFGRPATTLLVVEALFVVTTIALLSSFDRLGADRPLMDAVKLAGEVGDGPSLGVQRWSIFRAVVWLVGVPALLMGCTFPLANANVQRVAASVGRRAGLLYLANTLGSVLGSLLAGFVLLPRLGTQASVFWLAIAAAVALVPLHLSSRTRAGLSVRNDDHVFALTAVGLFAAIAAFRGMVPEGTFARRTMGDLSGEHLLDLREGENETVAVSVDGRGARRLWTNGHSMSGNDLWSQRYMRAFSHIPLLLQEAPRRALVICFGVGNTVHAASLHPSLERVELADLSRNVLEHAPFFRSSNHDVLEDPRVHVFVDDGRQHLRMTEPGSLDLVTLEPPPLSHAGVSALYSVELYELARSRLSPGGLMTQWLPIQELMGPEVLDLVRAFVDVFPGAVMLWGSQHDLILMGGPSGPPTIDPAAVERRLRERPEVRADLERVYLGSLAELVGTFAADGQTLARATAGARPVTDDWPSMEYSVVSKVYTAHIPAPLFDVSTVGSFCPSCAASPPRDLAAHLELNRRMFASRPFLEYSTFREGSMYLSLAEVLAEDDGHLAAAILRSAYLGRLVGIDPEGVPRPIDPRARERLEAYVAGHPDVAVAQLRLGLAMLAVQRRDDALTRLRRAVELAPESSAAWFALGTALHGPTDTVEEEISALRRGLAIAPGAVSARIAYAAALLAGGHRSEGISEARATLARDPSKGGAHLLLCLDAASREDQAEAKVECALALDNGARPPPGLAGASGEP